MKKRFWSKKIKSIKELKKIANIEKGINCVILLKYGLISRKTIRWQPKAKKFAVLNHIDNTKQQLTEKNIMDQAYTNIGEAMKKGALVY